MNDYILEMKSIVKEFPGVKALDNVNFKVKRGEIHALCGENGAGKSTLMKVLSGVHPYGSYDGDIILNGEVKEFYKIKDSEEAGIAIIYQELALVKQMNIAENIFLGNEVKKGNVIDWNETVKKTKKVLSQVGLYDNPLTKVINLGIGKQQLIEIAKAMTKDISILILDEPTAALNETESENLLNIIRELKNNGVTCIYISHKLNEVKEIADTITVIRDGQTIDSLPNDENMTEDKIISLMVGRELTERYPSKEYTPSKEVAMRVSNWNVYNPELPDKKALDDISLHVKKGEILGIAGLMGAGRTELAMSLFGAYGINKSGTLEINGKKVNIKNPEGAIKEGLCYLSEDRKKSGLVLMMDIKQNITLASLNKIKNGLAINENEEIKQVTNYSNMLRIKTPSIEQKTNNLSGGNQQKVVLGKWLMADPIVLILDEPTRGIDVGAKYEIYNIMNSLAKKGVSIIMISSELPEVLGMSDRVLVMHEGKVTGEIDGNEATQEKVMYFATGGM